MRGLYSKVFAAILLAIAFTTASPVILYGPELCISEILSISAKDTSESPEITFDSLENYVVSHPSRINSGGKRAFILLCEGQLLELLPNSQIIIFPNERRLEISLGAVFAHIEEPPAHLCYLLSVNSTELRYFGTDSLFIDTEDSFGWLYAAGQFQKGDFNPTKDSWAKRQSKDASYIFRKYDDGDIPDPKFRFRFPSETEPVFRHTSRGKGGIATYKETTYYYAGMIYRANLWELEFAYDFWFAFSEKGKFYDEAWNEWSDLIDHIHYIELFKPPDPFYLRAGLLQNITYGRGLLVSNYDNAVLLPFEKKSGLQFKIKTKNFNADAFVNDIGYPRVIGLNTFTRKDDRLRFSTTVVADLDMYSSIRDRDGDSYPDLADPEPDVFNSPSDSTIISSNPPSLDDVGKRTIFGGGAGLGYTLISLGRFTTDLSGEGAVLSNLGTGFSAPELTFRFGNVSIGGGLNFQTPGFFDGFIDGNYERDRGYLLQHDDGTYEITGRAMHLAETEGWLYGWSNFFTLNYPDYIILQTSFRDLYRDETRNKRLGIYLKNKYPWTPYIYSSDFFIEQKNVEHLFQKKTDGQQWGFSMQIRPHTTIRINVRYRERYADENLDGEITSREIDRNFNGDVVVHGDYWLRKYIEWRRKRRTEKIAEKSAGIPEQ